MSIRELAQQLAHSPKVAAGVSAMTTTTGAGTALEWIPDDIGKLATLVGVVLSVLLFRIHLVHLKKANLEYRIMKEKYSARATEVTQRKASGEPLRRDSDSSGYDD